MSIAHNAYSSHPLRSRKVRFRSAATGRESCFVCVKRFRGDMQATQEIGKEARKGLRDLAKIPGGEVTVSLAWTEIGQGTDALWYDWYRVPFGGRTFATLQGICKRYNLLGPCWGKGTVSRQACGSGVSPYRKLRLAKERQANDRAKAGFPNELLLRLFGDSFSVAKLESLPCKPRGRMPAGWEDQFPAHAWLELLDKWPEFGKVCHYVWDEKVLVARRARAGEHCSHLVPYWNRKLRLLKGWLIAQLLSKKN